MKGVFFLALLFLCSGVFAVSGVSPGGYEVDFEPGLSKSFEFSFVFDEYVSAELYVSGPLSEYVTLDKDHIRGRDTVTVFLSLPQEVKTPGVNIIRVGAKQLADDGGGIEIVSDIGGVIKVNVPYPGKYIELETIAPNANTGDLVNVSVKAYNRGKVSLEFSPILQIFNGTTKLETLNGTAKKTVAPLRSDIFYFSLNTSDYRPGNYTATALADYGEKELARDDDSFRLGELRVDIVNYSGKFEGGKINRFDIEVESYWNTRIDDLYAVVYLLDQEFVSFRTPSIPLGPWKRDVLVGFLDTEPVKSDIFMANITLHYGNKTTSQVVALKLEKGFDYTPYIFGFVAVLILTVLIWRIRLFTRRVKEHRRS
jgi:hypothetical protein